MVAKALEEARLILANWRKAFSFDHQYYKSSNSGVRVISGWHRLLLHDLRLGRHRDRSANASIIQGSLAATRTDGRNHSAEGLPPGFHWADYVRLNPDLARLNEAQAVRHYLDHGRRANYRYHAFDPELYGSLYFPGLIKSDAELLRHYNDVGRSEGRIGSHQQLALAEGFADEGWLDDLNVEQFALLNWSWAGPIRDKREAARAMRREGIARIAPLSFDATFDPAYYREAHPDLARLGDAALYEHWLFEGRRQGRSCSAQQHLKRLNLQLTAYPDAFDFRAYARGRRAARSSRWAALDHFVRVSLLAGLAPPLRDGDRSRFLVALAECAANRDDAIAIRLFEMADRHGEVLPSHRQHWADSYIRQERWSEALATYRAVAATPDAHIWTYRNGVTAALKLGDTAAALDLLRQSKGTVGGDVLWRDALEQTIQAIFGATWDRAAGLYRSGQRAEADSLQADTVAQIGALWTELDPLGLPIPPADATRVLLLANTDLRQCTHYRVEQKQQIAEAAGLDLVVFRADEVEAFLAALPGASAAIFYRLPAFPKTVRAIQVTRAMGVPSFYDIDDLIFDPAHYPEPFETYGDTDPDFYATLQHGVPLFRAAMALCDYGIATTEALARHMRDVVRTREVFVLPNGFDDRNAGFLRKPPARVRRDEAITLFYGSGSKAHNSDFLDLAGPGLVAAMTGNPLVRLLIVGHLSLDASFDAYQDRITQIGWVPDIDAYWSLLAEADVNLAVLVPHPTTDAKSEIKWIEAAALGIPSIVGATEQYRAVLEHGRDALIAHDSAEWTAHIQALIADPDLRRRIVAAARAKIQRNYSIEANARRLTSLLEPAVRLAEIRRAHRRGKKRILLLNLFFPPQTLGGSTRVVRDNLDAFLDSADARDCDFAVFTTDFDNPVPYQVRVENYRGVPVFRVSPHHEPNMEWQPRNERMGAIFDGIVEAWRPDLVHFHCLQRSTASPVEVCRARGIPYVNTIHDAWWVSDYNFMVDQRGRLLDAEEPIPRSPPPPLSAGDCLARRRLLRPLLEGSREILVVSDAFTRIMRDAGYGKARSVPNGVPPLRPVTRSVSPNGRVRLAYLGGRAHHKGYHLVEAALRQRRYRNLELTVVDHSRYGGQVHHETWGGTPVRIVGKTKQEEMHCFYADVDVLLAASIWPESFGLVSREAIAAGLWVVASNRGAIGEDVTPGLNGWVIDVDTLGPLLAALDAIDAEPGRYRQPPPRAERAQRTAADQAVDLIAIYRSILDGAPARAASTDTGSGVVIGLGAGSHAKANRQGAFAETRQAAARALRERNA